MVRICSVEDCGLEHHAKGFCQIHYRKNKTYGNPLHDKSRICSFDGCEVKHFGVGLCQKHYNQKYQMDNKEKLREYDHSQKRKDQRKINRDKPENKAKVKLRHSTTAYRTSEKERQQRPENIVKEKIRNATPKRLEQQKAKKILEAILRLNVLVGYSKRLSNSDVPCCNCCGENTAVEFLAIDHIAGKKQMDSIPELVKIGYSSKLKGRKFLNWITDNDFPDGIQILCHNCNVAKGLYGKCPHNE
jgi:hypothetical protein